MFWCLGQLSGPPRGKDVAATVGWGMELFLKLHPFLWVTLIFLLPGPGRMKQVWSCAQGRPQS